ncbi:MAG: ABC transporter permease subunit [Firmicutes bacterium]|nr:ABC transporter permease subunit [Bacillota bacterium]MCL2256427.1 ABC transporter permease subunit [Bacillota bacterium]
MKNFFNKLKSSKRFKKYFWITASVLFMIAIWWLLAETYFALSEVIPSPIQVLRQMGDVAGTSALWRNVWNTLWKVLVAFAVSFAISFLFAVLASWKDGIRHFLSPIVTVLRALPTIGIVFILFFIVISQAVAVIVIGFLMIFPVMYENFYAAIKETDSKLLQMARVHKVSFMRQLVDIYIPHMLPHLFASSIAGIGMGLKVTIAAEILSFAVVNDLGTAMWRANIDGGGLLFMWLTFAVILSFFLEGAIRLIAYFSMSWKRRKGGEK